MAITDLLGKVADIVNKRVTDKNAAQEINLELAKLDYQLTSQRQELLKADVIRYTFPALVGIIVLGYLWNITSGVISSFVTIEREMYIFTPPAELLEFLKWYCAGFFGYRIVGNYNKE